MKRMGGWRRFSRAAFLWGLAALVASVGTGGCESGRRTVEAETAAGEGRLREELLSAYRRASGALKRRDEKAVRDAFSSWRLRTLENELVSLKEPWDVRNMPELPEIEGYRVLNVERKGRTAAFVAVKRRPGSADEPGAIEHLAVRFVKEGGAWRVDWIETHVRSSREGSHTSSRHEPYEPSLQARADGVVRTPPPRVPPPEVVGYLVVRAVGCQVHTALNGILQEPVRDSSRFGVLIGGLRRSANTISIEALPLGENGSSSQIVHAEVEVLERFEDAATPQGGSSTRRVFHWTSSGPLPQSHRATFSCPNRP